MKRAYRAYLISALEGIDNQLSAVIASNMEIPASNSVEMASYRAGITHAEIISAQEAIRLLLIKDLKNQEVDPE